MRKSGVAIARARSRQVDRGRDRSEVESRCLFAGGCLVACSRYRRAFVRGRKLEQFPTDRRPELVWHLSLSDMGKSPLPGAGRGPVGGRRQPASRAILSGIPTGPRPAPGNGSCSMLKQGQHDASFLQRFPEGLGYLRSYHALPCRPTSRIRSPSTIARSTTWKPQSGYAVSPTATGPITASSRSVAAPGVTWTDR